MNQLPKAPEPRAPRRSPRLVTLHGATDCHLHIFGPEDRFPVSPHAGYRPPRAGIAAYRRLMESLKLDRCVVVQPSIYGTDNSATLSALAALKGKARGVGMVAPDVSDAELDRLHAAGVRGVRLSNLTRDTVPHAAFDAVADRIARLGWHIQLLADRHEIPPIAPIVARSKVPVVFDHMGRGRAEEGVSGPGFQTLLTLMREGHVWSKLSGPEAGSTKPPEFRDMDPFAEALIATAPDHLVWGTDWPHPGARAFVPYDADLLDNLLRWAPDAALQAKILVDNPARLYGFSD
jgi:2-pyrone-4,6-dicarboxylate lactonase